MTPNIPRSIVHAHPNHTVRQIISGEVSTNILKNDAHRQLPESSYYAPLAEEFRQHVKRTPGRSSYYDSYIAILQQTLRRRLANNVVVISGRNRPAQVRGQRGRYKSVIFATSVVLVWELHVFGPILGHLGISNSMGTYMSKDHFHLWFRIVVEYQ